MKIVQLKLDHPVYIPLQTPNPLQLEVVVSGVDLFKPVKCEVHDNWILALYGEYFYLFFDEGDLGERPSPEYPGALYIHEGYFNATGLLPDPVVRVTVTDFDSGKSREFFVPVPTVLRWLEEGSALDADRTWSLVRDHDYDKLGQIVFRYSVEADIPASWSQAF